jgi:hypothetical protein
LANTTDQGDADLIKLMLIRAKKQNMYRLLQGLHTTDDEIWFFWALRGRFAYAPEAPRPVVWTQVRRAHVIQGEFKLNAKGDKVLKGGCHSFECFDQFLSSRDDLAAFRDRWTNLPTVVGLHELVHLSEVFETLPNGVIRVQLPQDAFDNKAWKQWLGLLESQNGLWGAKTVFPKDMTADEIIEAVNAVTMQPRVVGESQTWSHFRIGEYTRKTGPRAGDKIWIRVQFDPNTFEIQSAFPTWHQPDAIDEVLIREDAPEARFFHVGVVDWYRQRGIPLSKQDEEIAAKNDKVVDPPFSMYMELFSLDRAFWNYYKGVQRIQRRMPLQLPPQKPN